MRLSGAFQIRATMAAMGGVSRPPDTGGGPPSPTTATSSLPARNAATPALGGGNNVLGHNPTSRPYEQIIAESNAPGSNFIIQIKLVKVENSSFPDHKPMNLTTPQIGDLIFKTLDIHHSSILEVDLITGRYDTRELLLRADTDLSKALTTLTPHLYNRGTYRIMGKTKSHV